MTYAAIEENMYRSSYRRCLVKKGALINFAEFTGKGLCQSVLFNKVKPPEACNFIKKENLAQAFSCEFWAISKNTFSYRTPLVDVSVYRFQISLEGCNFVKKTLQRSCFPETFLRTPILKNISEWLPLKIRALCDWYTADKKTSQFHSISLVLKKRVYKSA